jgi:hypothetical protein
MAPSGLLLFARHEAVRQRLHEGDERVLFRIGQAWVPDLLLFMLAVDSGAGQHVVPSPASWGLHRGRTSRVL